jgi:phytanoyl-CoA hydroxylase
MKDVMVARGAIEPTSQLEAIAKLQDYESDPVLDSYRLHPAVLDAVERIVGPNVMSIHTMLINKPPNVDGRHPLHQDLLYFPFRPADSIVATWTALEPVTRENGCLVVVPGSQRGELLAHGAPAGEEWKYLNGGYFGARDIDRAVDQRVHLPMEPGDTVFFHPILLHGSGRNRTSGFRRAISAHYARTDSRWEWVAQEDHGRRYRIVRGERAGQAWDGDRQAAHPVDPIDYLRPAAPGKQAVD